MRKNREAGADFAGMPPPGWRDMPVRNPPCACGAVMIRPCTECIPQDNEGEPLTVDGPKPDCWLCQGRGCTRPEVGSEYITVHFRGDCKFPLVVFWDADGRNRLWLEGYCQDKETEDDNDIL